MASDLHAIYDLCWAIFAEALTELKASGYVVKAWLLNAMYFGVPQSRERMIFIGVRSDLAERHGLTPTCPDAQTSPITFAEACADLRGNGPDDRMLGGFLLRFRHAQPQQWSTDGARYLEMKGSLGASISLQWALWERVCGTILKSEISLAGIVHPERERYISLAEARRCASFPDAFEFTNRRKGIERIGNSVPPKFMEAIAGHVYRTLIAPIHAATVPLPE
jgi:DNA (cytosine-5)-methyltransferase 1